MGRKKKPRITPRDPLTGRERDAGSDEYVGADVIKKIDDQYATDIAMAKSVGETQRKSATGSQTGQAEMTRIAELNKRTALQNANLAVKNKFSEDAQRETERKSQAAKISGSKAPSGGTSEIYSNKKDRPSLDKQGYSDTVKKGDFVTVGGGTRKGETVLGTGPGFKFWNKDQKSQDYYAGLSASDKKMADYKANVTANRPVGSEGWGEWQKRVYDKGPDVGIVGGFEQYEAYLEQYKPTASIGKKPVVKEEEEENGDDNGGDEETTQTSYATEEETTAISEAETARQEEAAALDKKERVRKLRLKFPRRYGRLSLLRSELGIVNTSLLGGTP